jgi:CheY-like chemotaxis protein
MNTSSISNQTKSICIIEDNVEFANYIKLLLESSIDANIELHHQGVDGLKACLRNFPDVLILDLNLPGLCGEEILRLLRSSEKHRKIKVLICSEMPKEQKVELSLLKLGAHAYIEKPFDEDKFIKHVNDLVLGNITVKEFDDSNDPNDTNVPYDRRYTDPDSTNSHYANNKTVFAGYQIIRMIGGGNMGTVYEALTRSGQHVALKVLLKKSSDDTVGQERFKREAQIMLKLDHPNILKVVDVGTTGFTLYIGLEYAEGGSLENLISNGQVPLPLALRIMEQCVTALIYLHENDIIHRDIKPANILLTKKNDVKIADFGISLARLSSDERKITQIDHFMGTPLYMAPELVTGSVADALSDQYSLGRTFYRMFEGEKAHFPPQPLQQINPNTPKDIIDLINQMVEISVENRFTNMHEIKTILKQLTKKYESKKS